MNNQFSDEELLLESNGMLRTFHAVVERRGEKTAWEFLEVALDRVLKNQHQRTNEIREAKARSLGYTEEKREEFEAVVKPIMRWLNDNGHPHMSIHIDSTSAELVSGEIAFTTNEFLRD